MQEVHIGNEIRICDTSECARSDIIICSIIILIWFLSSKTFFSTVNYCFIDKVIQSFFKFFWPFSWVNVKI